MEKLLKSLIPEAQKRFVAFQPMKLMTPQWKEWKGEKHTSLIKIEKRNKVTVDIGIEMGTPHPMTKEHWIMWIELICKAIVTSVSFLNLEINQKLFL